MRIGAITIERNKYVNIIKIIKDNFNKIFLFTINNKYEIIVRIFISIVESTHYTIANKVAIIDFFRIRLNILTSRVFA